jgi:hypothetical protein
VNCESPFNHDDYQEASLFFTQTLSALVVNAKLDRPLDSHAPQTEHVYAYVADDWGNAQEDEYETQWEEMANQWESSDHNEQNYEVEDTYATEEVREEQYVADDQDQAESDEFDEDDQDSYI